MVFEGAINKMHDTEQNAPPLFQTPTFIEKVQ